MSLYWLEQEEADVPAGDDWLSPWETSRLHSFRVAKRRADWRLGRWTAKQAVAFCLNLEWDVPALTTIEIRPAPSGAPEVFVNKERALAAISLSHRAGRALCAIARAGVELGCDLELIESHSDAFVDSYFTPEEQRLIANSDPHDRDRMASLLWSAKESALKALHEGLRLDTRIVSTSLGPESLKTKGWGQLQLHYANRVFSGWWQEDNHFVRTIVANAPSDAPIYLPVMPVVDRYAREAPSMQ